MYSSLLVFIILAAFKWRESSGFHTTFRTINKLPSRTPVFPNTHNMREYKEKFHPLSMRFLRMADPDLPPEVNPTRRDPDQPAPHIPVRLPVVDVDGTKMDVNSRLLKDRIIMIGKEVDDEMANIVVAQLLYLAHEDPKASITMYINSPGGSISSGMAIFDTMQFIPCNISTICFGTAASMGAFLLGAGTKGHRKALPNSRIMIHQPLGGAKGQAADIEIQAKEILFVRSQINAYLSMMTDQPIEKINADCDRDFYLSADQAVDYGLIDEVVKTKTSHIKIPPMSFDIDV
jgi:ATP-dependent Clp endopeptidase proteolytic subunit ClpP